MTLKDFKRFNDFYGPYPAQNKKYLLLTKQKEDSHYEFVKKNKEIWFNHKKSMKAKSNHAKY